MRRLALAALFLAACGSPPSASVPWDSDLPSNAHVIYTMDHGFGVCDGLQGCPTRIISFEGLCITEVYRGSEGWEFRESKPCEPTP